MVMRVQSPPTRVIVLEVILLVCASFRFLAHAAAPSLPDLSPVVSSIYPAGGRPGETLQVDMSGRRLDGTLEVAFARPDIKAELVSSNSNSAKVKVTVGPAVPTGLHDYRLKTPNGAFVGVFHVGTLPGGREVEPNDDIRRAQKIDLPAMMDGNIGGADFDVYRFHAEEGQTLIFDVLGRRAGSSLDANLGLLDERGNELDFNDDYYIHKDPQLTFPVKRAGDYFIRVGGQGEGRRGAGGAASYRLLAGAFPLIRRVLPAGARRGGDHRVARGRRKPAGRGPSSAGRWIGRRQSGVRNRRVGHGPLRRAQLRFRRAVTGCMLLPARWRRRCRFP